MLPIAPVVTSLLGSRLFWYAIAALTVLCLVGGAYWFVERQQAKIASLTSDRDTALATADALRSSLANTQKAYSLANEAVAERDKKVGELTVANGKLTASLKSLKARSKDVKVWMETPIPDAVADLLPVDNGVPPQRLPADNSGATKGPVAPGG